VPRVLRETNERVPLLVTFSRVSSDPVK